MELSTCLMKGGWGQKTVARGPNPGHRPLFLFIKFYWNSHSLLFVPCLWLLLHLTFYRRASTPPWREMACWGGGPGSRRWGLCRNGDLFALEKQPLVLGAHAGD